MEGLGSCLPFEGGSFKGSFQASSKGSRRVPKYALGRLWYILAHYCIAWSFTVVNPKASGALFTFSPTKTGLGFREFRISRIWSFHAALGQAWEGLS